MSVWMYHTLYKSVMPVPPATTVEEAAVLADKLPHRIYFEAELTTQPISEDREWWVKVVRDGHVNWHYFLHEEEAWKYSDALLGQVYIREVRLKEVFLTKQERS